MCELISAFIYSCIIPVIYLPFLQFLISAEICMGYREY